MKTYQFAGSAAKNYTYGVGYKIAYMANDTLKPHQACFQINGTNETEITIQAVLPDLTWFKVHSSCPYIPVVPKIENLSLH